MANNTIKVYKNKKTDSVNTDIPKLNRSTSTPTNGVDENEEKRRKLQEAKKSRLSKTIDNLFNKSGKLDKADTKLAKNTANEFIKSTGVKPTDEEVFESPELALKKERENFSKLSENDKSDFRKAQALANRTSKAYSFARGMGEAIPFLDRYVNKNEKKPDVKGLSQKEQKEAAQKQNSGAYLGGALTGNVASYALGNAALEGVSAFDKVGKAVTNAVPLLKNVNPTAIGNILRGQAVDTALDTLPRIGNDIDEGKSTKEIVGDALLNQASNLALNVGMEALPSIIDAKNVLKNEKARKVANAVDDLEIEDLAKDTSLDLHKVKSFEDNANDVAMKMNNGATITDTVEREMLSPDVRKTHSEKEIKTMNEYINSTDDGLENYIKEVRKSNYAKTEPYVIKDSVSSKMQKDIQDIHGIDTSEYKIAMDNNSVLHTDTDHGINGKTDHSMADDVSRARIQYILDNYDSIEKGNSTSMYKYLDKNTGKTKRADTVLLSKKIDGNYYVIEAIPDTEKKTLYIVSTYTDKSKGIKKGVAPLVNAPTNKVPTPDALDVNSITPDLNIQNPSTAVNNIPSPNVLDDSIPQPNIKEVDEIPSMMKQRGYAESIQNKTDLPSEIKAEFDNDMYKVLSNAETSAKADANYVQGDVMQSISNFNTLLKNRDASAIPLGSQIAKDLIATGEDGAKAQAVDILRQMSAELTRSGQFSQSAAITLMQNDPMTAMRYMQKEIDTLNRTGANKYGKKWSELALTSDEIDKFNGIDPGDADSINELYTEIRKRLGKEVPSSLWEKIVSVEKTAMLLNPLTHIRNVVANVLLMPVRSTTDRVSAIGQNIAHLINPDVKVTQSLVGGGKEEKKIASEMFESLKDSILGDNKMIENGANEVMRNKQIFKDDIFGKWVNKVTNGGIEKLNAKFGRDVEGNLYETLSNFNMWMMGEVEDNPFVKQNFVNRLASYMKAQGIKDVNDIPEDAVSLAIEEAMKATFKDDNAMTSLLSGIKNKTGKFGEVMLPFTKTPANLAMRALDYSPVGIINSVKDFKKTKDASKFIDDLSKNLLGSAGIYFSYQMAKHGVISGAYSDDKKEQAYQKANGEQEYAINLDKLGDFFGIDIPEGTSYTFDWAQPTSIPMILGAAINDAIKTSDDEDSSIIDYLNVGKDAGMAAFDRWFELSPLQSLKEIMSGDGYGNDSIGENITQSVIDFPSRMIPSVVGAAARTKDNVIRDSYDKTDAVASWKNSIKAKLPGLSETLPASYDMWGRERTRSQSTGEKIAEQFYSPGKIGTDTSVDITDKLQSLSESTNMAVKDLLPGMASRSVSINNETKDLTNKEHSDYQKMRGELSYQFAKEILNSNMSDSDKAEAIKDAYSLADTIAKRDLFGYEPKTKTKELKAYDKGNVKGYLNYLQSPEVVAKNLADDYEVGNSKAFQKSIQNGTEKEYVETYKAITSTSLGTNDEGEEIYLKYNDKTAKVYADKGQKGLVTYSKIKQNLPKDAKDLDLLDAISKSNMSDEDKAYYYVNMRSHKMGKIPASFDNDYDKYQYYVIKDLIDADDNGSIKKSEAAKVGEVLRANGYDEEYIKKVVDGKWFSGGSSSSKSGSGSSKKKSSSLKTIGTTHPTSSRSTKLHYTSMNPTTYSSNGVPTLFSTTYNNKDWYTKTTKKIPSLRS